MITRTYLNDAGEVVTEEVSPADFYRAAQDEHETAMTTPPSPQEERVARAIVSARGVDPDASMRRRVAAHGKDSDFEHAYFMWEDALAEARAAIAAMQWVEVERIDTMRLMLSDWLVWSESKDLSLYRYVESGDMHADISSLAHSTREVLRLQPHSLNSAQSAPNQSGEKT